jgi:hypothetical protein
MLVYHHREQTISPRSLLEELRRASAAGAACRRAPHDTIVDLLIRAGELEATIVDALCPEQDDDQALARECRRATLSAARALVASRAGDDGGVGRELDALSRDLRAIYPGVVPTAGTIRTCEGYALYGLYPEVYADAAERCQAELRPAEVCCIGIRSIGTSLSAVVGAAFERAGVAVRSVTVRPRGSPLNRVMRATDTLTRAIGAHRRSYFAVIDEGPGLSGSTVAAVAAWLSGMGVPDHRVILFPSHPVNADLLGSALARAVWQRSRVYVGAVEPDLSRRLCGAAPMTDISAGRWRREFLEPGVAFPAAHPQHERRKFLTGGSRPAVLRFAGIGRYGTAVHARACALADAGFTPPVEGLREGFLRLQFVAGRPATAADVSASLLERVAQYATYLRQHAPAVPEHSSTSLEEMLLHNTAEALDADGADRLHRALPRVSAFEPAAAVAIDGRMLPHEWIATDDGTFVKTDAFDHFRDDFFPGPTDIAWDLAGASIEFGLSRSGERWLVDRYRRLSGDSGVERRLRFFRLAYLGYRAGYTAFARATLAGTADGRRFARLADHYATRLRLEVDRVTNAPNAP